MKVLSIGFVFLSHVAYSVPATGYQYVNCADQRQGLPLQDCAAIDISSDLATITVRDYGEEIPQRAAAGDRRFKAIESSILPIAIPSTDYATTARWEHRGHTYVKLSTNSEIVLPWRHHSDVIVAFPTKAETSALPPVARELRKVAELVFRYSEREGVTAIAFPDLPHDSGEVFYCVAKPCLFATDF